jgi:hypothetical protein
MTVYWAPFLHLYQPPWQDVEVLRRINNECYIPLFSMLDRHDNARMTINIQGCLLDLLIENDLQPTVELLQKLVHNGKVELVGSAKYHPLLPLIPRVDVNNQIRLNENTMKQFFGEGFNRHGFFPPEMAVSPESCGFIKEYGYEWIIMSGIANTGDWPTNFIQQQKCGILTFFRDDYLSNEISFKKIETQAFVQHLDSMNGSNPQNNDNYVITAQDGETFGHHHRNYETSFLGKAFSLIEDMKTVKVEFITNLKNKFPIKAGPPIRSCTWSTDWGDISSNVPYPLWKHPFNPVHKVQYRMLQALYRLIDVLEANAAGKENEQAFQDHYRTARWFYDMALHSCWLWWASQRPHWSPNLIYKGADLVMKTALNAQLALINLRIGDGDEDYSTIMDNMQKLMVIMCEQEIAFRRVTTF